MDSAWGFTLVQDHLGSDAYRTVYAGPTTLVLPMVNPETNPPFQALQDRILQRASLTSHLVDGLAYSAMSNVGFDQRGEFLQFFHNILLALVHFR